MTAGHPLDELIDAQLPAAMQLAISVHDRDAEGVTDVLEPLLDATDRDWLGAFMVALASLADPDRSVDDALAWSHDEPMGEQLPLGELVIGEGEKYCPDCAQVLPLEDFHVDNSRKDGRHRTCRQCRSVTEAGPSGHTLFLEARALGLGVEQAAQEAGITARTGWEYERRARKAAGEVAA